MQLVQSPVNVNVGDFDQPLAKSYNVNVAFQRDIGFNTVAEIAYVGNFQYEGGRTVDVNRLPLYVYGNPANLVNNAPLNANSLRQCYGPYPGMGSVTQFVPDLYTKSLDYNAHAAQRAAPVVARTADRLCVHLRHPATVTQGYDPYTDQIGGEGGAQGPLLGADGENRSTTSIVNYSYDIPSFTENAFVKPIVRDWQVSGVTRLLSGAPITPSCSSNNAGIQNSNPSLTDGITSRCQLVG